MNRLLGCIRGEGLPNDHDLPGTSFRWIEISDGTGDFQRENRIGEGNFGSVYRCVNLPGTSERNQVGAAKIQNLEAGAEARREFVREIRTLHAAHHPNVIGLLGKCTESERRVIVYEFMPRGSLEFHLYEREKIRNPPLDWDTRMGIALGVAEGLNYVHEQLNTIHLDIKDANVLLDANFVPKLTDFGLSRSKKYVKGRNGRNRVEKERKMNPIKGTLGFIAPETRMHGKVSTKSDVYSYGVFVLALFTGRKAYDTTKPEGKVDITDWFAPAWNNQYLMAKALDFELGNRYSKSGLRKLFEIVRSCLSPLATLRPQMGYVADMVREASNCPIRLPPTRRVSIDDEAIQYKPFP